MFSVASRWARPSVAAASAASSLRRRAAAAALGNASARLIHATAAARQDVPLSAGEDAGYDVAPTAVQTSWKGVKRFYLATGVAPAPPLRRMTREAMLDASSASDVSDSESSSAAAAGAPAAPDANTWWQVTIDGRALRTHGMHDFRVPSQALALAIAAEFAAQGTTIVPATCPLYNLASLAIDTYLMEDPVAAADLEAEVRAGRLSLFDSAFAAQGKGRAETDAFLASAAGAGAGPSHTHSHVTGRSDSGAMTSGAAAGTPRLRDLLLDYLETDSLCYRVDPDLGDPSEKLLRKRQDMHYEPLIKWFAESYGPRLGTAVGFGDTEHPEEAYVVAEDLVDLADPWLKACLQQAVGALKSTVLTTALIHRRVGVEEACEIARLEEEWQIGQNGFVEDGHDTSRALLRTTVAAISSFLWMLPASMPAPLPSPTRRDYVEVLEAEREARTARVAARRKKEADLVEFKRKAMAAWDAAHARAQAAGI